MTRWSIGVNGYFGVATIYHETGPWWSFLVPDVVSWILSLVPAWRLPDVWMRRRIERDGSSYSWGEWYGNTLAVVTASWINAVYQWGSSKQRHVCLSLPMRDAMEAFAQDTPLWWWEEWERGTEQWKRHGAPDASRARVYRRVDECPLKAGAQS